ncbi:hypothetical protein BpHYR1_049817 [Brachionus plicatilis]|uniref:Uncharacterized protein n=1 Tax=Brachionus plicatilis TaxID=10195 RepID=A0A3M7Q098_BRAPC|nr:hypothetical protein BpHYR1_049817 [Brachionus plicatilis]
MAEILSCQFESVFSLDDGNEPIFENRTKHLCSEEVPKNTPSCIPENENVIETITKRKNKFFPKKLLDMSCQGYKKINQFDDI